MALRPLNDVALIEVERNPYKIGGQALVLNEQKAGVETGILKELPVYIPYLGFHSFAFENSLGDVNGEVEDHYKELVGKRVYWVALADRGMVLAKDGVTYAMIKLTDLIGWSDIDEIWTTDTGKVNI